MTPVLYPANTTTFITNGIGFLTDAVSCVVTEERNGAYELVMQYPETGIQYAELANDRIILAKPNETSQTQPFRIYRISRPIDGVSTVYAEHISYQLSSIPVGLFEASNAPEAMAALMMNAATYCPFTMWTNKTTEATFKVTAPSSIRAKLGGEQGSILDVYGGEYEFDRYTVKLHAARGADNGVTIRYGKNITDIKQEENIQNLITGVYPYWISEEAYVELPEKVVTIASGYSYARVIPLDCTGEFEEKPTPAQLRDYATSYLSRPGIGIPKVYIQFSFIQVWQTAGNEALAALERVSLCDTVTVIFEKLGINATAKVNKTVYNVLKERYDSISVGDATSNLQDAILEQEQEIKKLIENSDIDLEAAARAATEEILAGVNGYVSFSRNANGKIYEILIMDTEDTNTAVRVWRWNSGGLGYSSTGYNGTYGTAITASGQIVADFITTGTLNAALVNVTQINASNITTGRLSANLIQTNGMVVGGWVIRDDVGLYYGSESAPSLYLGTTGKNLYINGTLRSNIVMKVGNYFGVDANGTAYMTSGLFSGQLSSATGTFSGNLTANTCYFNNLQSNSSSGTISIGSWLFKNDGMEFSGGIFDVEYSGGIGKIAGTAPMQVGPYTNGVVNTLTLFGTTISVISSISAYNMRFWVPGTNETSLTPITPGTCNIGTQSYYFDYVYAAHHNTVSLRAAKKNIVDLGDDDYDFMSLRPVLYEEKRSDSGTKYLGFIAEEVEEACKYAVAYDKDTGELGGLDYSRFTVILTRELQRLIKRVEALEERQ